MWPVVDPPANQPAEVEVIAQSPIEYPVGELPMAHLREVEATGLSNTLAAIGGDLQSFSDALTAKFGGPEGWAKMTKALYQKAARDPKTLPTAARILAMVPELRHRAEEAGARNLEAMSAHELAQAKSELLRNLSPHQRRDLMRRIGENPNPVEQAFALPGGN